MGCPHLFTCSRLLRFKHPKKRNISKKEISSLDHDPYSGFLKDKENLERDYKKIFGKDKS